VCYSPEFIAQGSIVYGMKNPDMVLIGGENDSAVQKVVEVYKRYVTSDPQYSLMRLSEAEICKISVNCFLTTKISFANTVGDIVLKAGGDPQRVLNAVGADSRIGKKYLRWGHGFGGPCLPRDNRALSFYADKVGIQNKVGIASDEINVDHLARLVEYVKEKNLTKRPVFFNGVVYKKNTTILEESQQLELAKLCAKEGMYVILHDSEVVLNALEKVYGEKFEYRYKLEGNEEEKYFDLNKYVN
jgi:UDPglucose 6-dehydrogenase